MAGSVYWDEWSQRWMVDDSGRPRQATPEEVEAYLADLSDQVWGPKVQHG
jgi:hypothetical protein